MDKVNDNWVILLDKPLSIEIVDLVKSVILALVGVNRVAIDESSIHITFDSSMKGKNKLKDAFAEIELAIESGWFGRLRQRLIHHEMQNKRINPQ